MLYERLHVYSCFSTSLNCISIYLVETKVVFLPRYVRPICEQDVYAVGLCPHQSVCLSGYLSQACVLAKYLGL